MPQTTVDESGVLLSCLSAQRDHVLGILDGLPEDTLRRSVLPSGWTFVGMVRHLAIDVERFWFRTIVAGESVDIDAVEPQPHAWQVPPEMSGGAVLDLYRQEIEHANGIIAARSLDSAPSWWPVERWPDWRFHDVRRVILHVMTETACHAGHLDAARELVDGRTWLVLTD